MTANIGCNIARAIVVVTAAAIITAIGPRRTTTTETADEVQLALIDA